MRHWLRFAFELIMSLVWLLIMLGWFLGNELAESSAAFLGFVIVTFDIVRWLHWRYSSRGREYLRWEREFCRRKREQRVLERKRQRPETEQGPALRRMWSETCGAAQQLREARECEIPPTLREARRRYENLRLPALWRAFEAPDGTIYGFWHRLRERWTQRMA